MIWYQKGKGGRKYIWLTADTSLAMNLLVLFAFHSTINQRSVHRLTWKIRSTELITRSLEKCNIDVYSHSIVEASGEVALTFSMVLKQVLMAQNMN